MNKLTLVSVCYRGKLYSAFVTLKDNTIAENDLFRIIGLRVETRGLTYSVG